MIIKLKWLEEKVSGSEFGFDSTDLLRYKLHKFKKKWGSYIGSPIWFRNKKATINSKNNDAKCFQCFQMLLISLKKIMKQ